MLCHLWSNDAVQDLGQTKLVTIIHIPGFVFFGSNFLPRVMFTSNSKLDLITACVTFNNHFSMLNILIQMTWCPRPLLKCLHQEREANVQCLPLAGRERRPVSAVRTPGTRIILKCDLTMYTALYTCNQFVSCYYSTPTIFSVDHQRWWGVSNIQIQICSHLAIHK